MIALPSAPDQILGEPSLHVGLLPRAPGQHAAASQYAHGSGEGSESIGTERCVFTGEQLRSQR